MNAGRLNRKIEVWKNELRENPETICLEPVPVRKKTVWASITPKTGSLLSGRPADTLLSKTTHKVTIRKSAYPELTPDCWLVYRNHRYDIDYILDPYMSHDYYEIFVQEVQ